MKFMSWAIILCVLHAHVASADAGAEAVGALQQQVQELRELVQDLNATVQRQQQRITALERDQSVPQATPSVAVSRVTATPAGLQAFNPEIGVVADMVGRLSESSADGDGNDKLSVREIELVFGHPIDPYSRFDSTITFSDFESPDIEEAYVTHWGLPGGITARLGRMRPKIGKASAVHGDALETVDEPLVVQRYLGAEGLFRTGMELAGFIPTPWMALTHEVTVGAMEGGVGEGGQLFGEARRRPSFYIHLKNFWNLSEASTVEVGSTYLTGSKDADARYEVNAVGLDAILVHFLTPTNPLKLQNELYVQDRKESFSIADDGTRTGFNRHPWGFYSLVDYRASPRIGVGGRFDYVEPVDLNPSASARGADTAWSGALTIYQSEFSRWRLQFRHTSFANGGDDNAVFAQGTVAIGVHKHQLQ